MVKINQKVDVKKTSIVKSTKKTDKRTEEVEVKKKIERKFNKEKLNVEMGSYIYKLSKNMAPGLQVQKKTLNLTNQLTEYIFESIMTECEKLMKRTNAATMSEETIKSAVKLMFKGKQMESHALMYIQSHLNTYSKTIQASSIK
mmetsp:Transcript_38826/g.32776  ORF Transcript_38826/g.32776 Transcript_38826/m.32776 type:complete len:144 (+) Transcript_38826:21-452(+)